MASAELKPPRQKISAAVGDEHQPASRVPRGMLDADTSRNFWQVQAAILDAEQNRPKLRLVSDA